MHKASVKVTFGAQSELPWEISQVWECRGCGGHEKGKGAM